MPNTKLTKQAEALDRLRKMVTNKKTAAEEAQKTIDGEPGADTNPEKVSDKTETTDKDAVNPENVKQETDQKKTDDDSTPVDDDVTKEGSEIEKLAKEIRDEIKRMKVADAQDAVVGKPGEDTNPEKVSDETETTDKDAVKPENVAQVTDQMASVDDSIPVDDDVTKAATVKDKVAAYELGKELVDAILRTNQKTASAQPSNSELLKMAGARDMDVLVASAQQELAYFQKEAEIEDYGAQYAEQYLLNKQAEDQNLEEQAEAEGAAYYDTQQFELQKQAAVNQLLAEYEVMEAKVAEYEQIIRAAQEEQKNQELVTKVAEAVFARLNVSDDK